MRFALPASLLALLLSTAAFAQDVQVPAAEDHAEGEDHDHDEHAEGEDHDDHDHDEHGEGDDDHLATLEGLEVLHAWARAANGSEGGVYMEIFNEGDTEVTLAGAKTDMAGSVALVGAPVQIGGETVPIGTLPMAPGEELVLDPAGLFWHLDGLTGPLVEGETFEMTLTLDPLGTLDIVVEIEAADADNHSHAGHAH